MDLDTRRVKINLENRIVLLFREADCLAKLNLKIPIVALTILSKREHFLMITNSLQLLMDEYMATSRKVKHEVRPLLLPHLAKVALLLKPGFETLGWAKPDWKRYYESNREQIKTFEILISRVHDVYDNRCS